MIMKMKKAICRDTLDVLFMDGHFPSSTLQQLVRRKRRAFMPNP